jgi:hypothetical protein
VGSIPGGVGFLALLAQGAVLGYDFACPTAIWGAYIGQKAPTSAWEHCDMGFAVPHLHRHNSQHRGSIAMMFFGNPLGMGMIRGFKH